MANETSWTVKHSERAAARLLLLQGADTSQGFLDRACRMAGWTAYILGVNGEPRPSDFGVASGEAAFRAILGGSYFGFDVGRQDLEVRIVLGRDVDSVGARAECGIDELRTVVNILDHNNESFNTGYTSEELLQIVRMCRASAWDIYPDQWTKRQRREALVGIVPRWSDAMHPAYSPLSAPQQKAAVEQADLLRAIRRGAGHDAQCTSAVSPLVELGLLRIDPDLDIAELTDQGQQWLDENPEQGST